MVSPPFVDTAANAQELELDGAWEDGQPALQVLCSWYLNYDLHVPYRTANWRQRPMQQEMHQYAAIAAQVLLPLQDAMQDAMECRARSYAAIDSSF